MQYEKAAEIRDALSEIDRLTENRMCSAQKRQSGYYIPISGRFRCHGAGAFYPPRKMIGGDSFLLEREGGRYCGSAQSFVSSSTRSISPQGSNS